MGYFRRHWAGELSLPVSYWLNGFLLTYGFVFTLNLAIGSLANGSEQLPTTSTLLLFLMIAPIPIQLWAWIGIWRSASNPNNKSNGFWKIAAKIAVILGVIQALGLYMGNYAQQISEHFKIATGNDPMGKITVQMLSDGRTISVSGPIGSGSYHEFKYLLDRVQGVQVVLLDSIGGRLGEAERIAKLIKEKRLNTYVEKRCNSFCTIVFLAGDERAATPRAQIGFHRAKFPGLTPEQEREVQDTITAVYQSAKLSPAFIAKVQQVPFEDMWYPSRQVLLEERVVTRVSFGGETTALTGALTRNQIEAELNKSDLFQLYEARFPGTIKSAAELGWKARIEGKSDNETMAAMRSVLSSKIWILFSGTPFQMQSEIVRLTIKQLYAAKLVSASACQSLTEGKITASHILPPELVKEEEALVRKALAAPEIKALKTTDKEYEQIIAKLFLLMSPSGQKAMIDNANGKIDPKSYCDSTIEMMEMLMKMSERERSHAIYKLFVLGSQTK